MNQPLPIIQSIPHAGFGVPHEVVDALALHARDIYNDCDLWVDQLFDFAHTDLAHTDRVQAEIAHTGVDSSHSSGLNVQRAGRGVLAVVSFDIARVLIDVNRKPDDLKNPDGMIKTQSSYEVANYTKPLDRELLLTLRERYYAPYHRRMEAALTAHQGRAVLLLDCHNMAQTGPSGYAHAGKPRPLICLANLGDSRGDPKAGGPAVTCPPELLRAAGDIAAALFADMDLLQPDGPANVVGLNYPFPGGYIIRRYTQGQRQASPVSTAPSSIMVEVNRGLFVGRQSALTPVAEPNLERIAAVRNRLYRWATQVASLFSAQSS